MQTTTGIPASCSYCTMGMEIERVGLSDDCSQWRSYFAKQNLKWSALHSCPHFRLSLYWYVKWLGSYHSEEYYRFRYPDDCQ